MPKHTKGTVHATACPHCGKANDFRNVEDYGLEQWQDFKCDHCGKLFHITRLLPTTMVWLAVGPTPPNKR